ncbi:MFS transporter [Glutamicibacter sp. NPDC087344]|uniref:MFS transporter n=1 Tax=Glutamicibacter sp. NPDC087344 TaxID=3363994 RepID=UPI00380B5410
MTNHSTIRDPAKSFHQTGILAVVLMSYFMILLDNSVIFTALPSVQNDLDLSSGELSWVQDAYTLVFGGLLLIGARAGDLFGRRRVFVFGLMVFSLASALIGLAPVGWWAIAGRALQGVGAAIIAPTSLSLLTASFPPGHARNRAVAWYGAIAGIGASLGLVIGGVLAHWVSWRAGFFVNVPLGLAMMFLAPRFLVETPRARGRFDILGAACATLSVGLMVFGIINTTQRGWVSFSTLLPIWTGIILLGCFVAIEAKATQPIMPLSLFASRRRTGAYLARLLYMGAMIGFFYFLTQFMQYVLGFNPLQAGLGFLPMTIVNFVVALTIPKIVRRLPASIPLLLGIAFTLAGMYWLSTVHPHTGFWDGIAPPMALIGIGQGLAFAPLTSFGIINTPVEFAGAASGLVNTFHQMGMTLGLGIMVACATGGPAQTSFSGQISAEVYTALTVGCLLLVLSFLAVLFLVFPGDLRAHRKRLAITTEPTVGTSRR